MASWTGEDTENWVTLQTEPQPPAPDPPTQMPAIPCFLTGTRILTDTGDTQVENLAIGQFAITAENELSAITWIGRRDLDLRTHPIPALVRPIRIAAGALSMGVPERDLLISPDHGLYFDGSLIQAKDLIDGIAIKPDPSITIARYYHIELETHGILLAEGAGAESYLDGGHRGVFSHHAGNQTKAPGSRQGNGVAPLVVAGEELAAIRARLHGRKLMLGMSVTEAAVYALKLDGLLVHPAEQSGGKVSFPLPPETKEAIFCSAVFVPAETDPSSDDRRQLGVAIADILLDGRLVAVETVMAADNLHRRAPWESAAWTSGAARLTIPPGTTTITFNILAAPRVWRR